MGTVFRLHVEVRGPPSPVTHVKITTLNAEDLAGEMVTELASIPLVYRNWLLGWLKSPCTTLSGRVRHDRCSVGFAWRTNHAP
jgi:hypothetical protein